MSTPRQLRNPDPDHASTRDNALKLVQLQSEEIIRTLRHRDVAIRFAHDSGASSQQIAEHAGIGEATVEAICRPGRLRR